MIKIAINVIRAELLAMGYTMAGLLLDINLDTIVELHPIEIFETIKSISFSLSYCTFFFNSLYRS